MDKDNDILKTPEEWSKIEHITIIDPDGWRGEKSFNEPISRDEFMRRVMRSTIQFESKE